MALLRDKVTESEMQKLYGDVMAMNMKPLQGLSVLTSCDNFKDILETLPAAIARAETVQRDCYRAVVLLSLSAIIAAPGNFKDPNNSLQDSMNMFKQHALFKGMAIPRKLHDRVLAQMTPKQDQPTHITPEDTLSKKWEVSILCWCVKCVA